MMIAANELNYIKSTDEKPEQAPNSNNSKWIRIHFVSGASSLGFYSYSKKIWREFKDLKNLNHVATIDERTIKGWNY